jgi:hypothetical protein
MNNRLTFTLTEETNPLRTRCIADLCNYLTETILVPRFTASGVCWQSEYIDAFGFDNTCDPLEPTGTIIFTVPPMFAGNVASLELAIGQTLARLNIKVEAAAPDSHSGEPSALVRRIRIVDNPTALLQPPEVNMGVTRGMVVLRDVLGYQPSNGRYEFSADDLLRRVSSVTEDKIAACTTSPVRDKQALSGVRRQPSPVSMRAIHRCLDEIRLFAQWAIGHNYRRLAAY